MKSDHSVIDSNLVARQFASDPDLRLPNNPRFPPELVTVPFGHDGVLIAGARYMQVIRGAAARRLLPRLLLQLDGRHTLDEIAALVPPFPPAIVRNAVTLLYSRGLLEDGRPATTPDPLTHLAAFAGRFGDVTRANRNRREYADRLTAAKVLLEGSPNAVATLRVEFAESGIEVVDTDYEALAKQPGTWLVIAAATTQAVDLGATLQRAKDRNCLALYVRLGEAALQLGPLFVPGRPICYQCMRRLHDGPGGDADPAHVAFWLSFVALHVCQLLGRLSTLTLHHSFVRYEFTPHGIIQSHHHVAGIPGCPTCALGEPALDPKSDEFTTWLLHASVAMPPHEFINPREHQNHYTAANIALTGEESEPYYGAPIVKLPDADALTAVRPWVERSLAGERFRVEDLATLLCYASGYRRLASGHRRRIAPTGGGLGSPDLFVIAREIDGLPLGIYHYHSPSHVLERLPDSSVKVLEAALGTRESLPPCVLIGAGALGKVRSKYHNFAYRLVNLDAGIALSYLMDVAASSGHVIQFYRDTHDGALAEAASLPTKDDLYVPTYAVGLSSPPKLQPDRGQHRTTPPALLRSVIRAVSRGHFMTGGGRLQPTQSRGPQHGGRAGVAGPPKGVSTSELPPTTPSLGELLMRRRSVRTYEPRPLSHDTVKFVARLGSGMHRELTELAGLDLKTRIWIVLHMADELSPGLYEVLTIDGSLRLHRPHVTIDELMRCLLQRSLALAPAFAFVTGDIGSALSKCGPRGYRELLLFAGAIISRMWLGATSCGVGACATAGLVDDGLTWLTGRSVYREAPLFGLTMGYPAGAPR